MITQRLRCPSAPLQSSRDFAAVLGTLIEARYALHPPGKRMDSHGWLRTGFNRFRQRVCWTAAGIAIVLLAAGCAAGGGMSKPPLTSSLDLDLPRFMGTWHVIANIPYFGERGNVASKDVYALNADGNVDTVYEYRKAFDKPEKSLRSVGLVQPGSNDAYWKVRFFGIFKADLLVLEVAPDYSWALIGQPKRKLAWIFGREPVMDDALYADLLQRMGGYGYDTGEILRVPQVPEQVGKAGFQ
jgi:apolipoprotein D and lipocalin family protein